MSDVLSSLDYLSVSLTKRTTDPIADNRLDRKETGVVPFKIFFSVNTGDGYDVTPTAKTAGLCVIPANCYVIKGVLNFEAMGTGADLDLGVYGFDGNGRYDDTLDTTEVTTLVSGQYYMINAAGGNFANVGAPDNNPGTVFKATGTTPTTAVACLRVGLANDADLFLDGIDVSSAGVDTFCDIENSDTGYLFETKKDLVLVATALTADWASDKDLVGWVEVVQK